MQTGWLAAVAIIGAASLAVCAGSPAEAQSRSGQLRCTVAGGFGLVVTSGRATNCVYYRPDGVVEFYLGQSSHYGVDVGPTNAVRLAYHVIGADPTRPGELAGNFAGVGLAATVRRGLRQRCPDRRRRQSRQAAADRQPRR